MGVTHRSRPTANSRCSLPNRARVYSRLGHEFAGRNGMASPAPNEHDVGRTLRRARHEHHARVEDAAEATRIPKKYLEALESNAPLDIYPAAMYARAFLREYARYLDLDPEPLLAGFGGVALEVRLPTLTEAVA